MGKELTDLKINFAQQLFKEQFKHINGLHSTLLQEKQVTIMKNSAKNRLQMVCCKERKHWIAATTINCAHDEVKLYDSPFQYLDKVSMECIKSLHNYVPVRVRMIQYPVPQTDWCQRLWSFAVAFATAIAFGQNPSRQNFK